MEKKIINYDTILNITRFISQSRDFEEVTLLIVQGIRDALGAKGCALFLVDPKIHELRLMSAIGLSDEYLNKGPISALKSISDSLQDGPVAISDVSDDPRLQYPEEAVKEGISSILSVPILIRNKAAGAIRIYTAEQWDVTLDDVNFVQAVAQIAAMALEMARLYKGLKSSIEILKTQRDPSLFGTKRWTPHEGVPSSVSPGAFVSEQKS